MGIGSRWEVGINSAASRLALVIGLGLIAGAPPPLPGQRLSPGAGPQLAPRHTRADSVRPTVPDGDMVAAGVLGAGVGWAAGGTAGLMLERQLVCGSDDFCGLRGFLVGGMYGQGVLISAFVHSTNRNRGKLRGSLLATGAVATVGAMLLQSRLADSHFGSIVLAVPVAQIAAAITVEKAIGRRPDRR